ncbi:unnamed protein product [Ceutorhynchus assimilis]|uniref:Kelch-like protein diablo n=1 Tax=Ceutorhynchus assimilis TaxID=467358 RepID=A0A9N9QK81_9CUCU|nr:unnamed protein product [Ceutorhynchus assimilis]
MALAKGKLPYDDQQLHNTVYEHYLSHQTTLRDGLNSLREKGELLDITLIIEGHIFRAHKAVLSACSDYFRAMFTDNMLEATQNEICLNGLSANGFDPLLEYAYSGYLTLNLANVQDVLAAASHIQMIKCVYTCAEYLQSQIDLDNCLDIATIAETYSLETLKVKAYRFISGRLMKFSTSSGFYNLRPVQLETLLAYDFPVDCAEADVFSIILSWFFHVDNKLDVHTDYARRIMKYINFEDISDRRFYSILESFFQDTNDQWQIIRNIIQESFLQTRECLFSSPMMDPLLNSRGMEQAILSIGGFGGSGLTNEIDYTFTKRRKWMRLTTIPHLEQCNYGTAVYDNELYIVGGCFNQCLEEHVHPFGFKYNPRFDKWTSIAPMEMERCRFSLNELGGLLYAVGGSIDADRIGTSICECYNPARDTWYRIQDLPARISQHAGASMENSLHSKLFISGGIERDWSEICLATVYCYDTGLERWTTCAPLPTPRADHVMLSRGNELYACGGWTSVDDRELVDTIDVYNAEQDTWKPLTKVPTPRFHAGITLVNDRIYFIGGFQTDTYMDEERNLIECYDIENQQWTVENEYPEHVSEHTCITLYIPKGRDDKELYDFVQ